MMLELRYLVSATALFRRVLILEAGVLSDPVTLFFSAVAMGSF